MTLQPADLSEDHNLGFRAKRRAAKVDYTEKKEDYDFESAKDGGLKKNGGSPTKEATSSPLKKKRKNNNGSNGKGANASRSESPVSSLEHETDSSNYSLPLNYQPEVKDWRFSNVLNLEGAVVKNRLELILKDGTSLRKDENVYMICEPPGEPYYIGRIMGFVNKNKQKQQGKITRDLEEPAEDYSFKINWWYRSRDISKHSTDSRLVYASMHSDVCPIQSFRGKCTVKHKDEIDDFEEYKSKPNQFWFDKFFDRYMIKFYDVLPTILLTSLPINYRTALNKRFQYIFVEQGKTKDMLQQPKSCVKCHQWSSSNDSIECCECSEIYHMLCLDPPIFKKPARGFAWSCINCSKKLERQKMIPNDDISHTEEGTNIEAASITATKADVKKIPLYEELAIQFLDKDKHLSFQERRNLEEWTYRYLGMHAKLEDALDVEDRPYARAASRLGPKNQLTGVQLDWFDHPVVYYDDSELNEDYQGKIPTHGQVGRKRKVDGRKKRNKNDNIDSNDTTIPLRVPAEYENVDPEEFPPWLQHRPKGYIERGGDDGLTAELLWKNPTTLEGSSDTDVINTKIEEYVKSCDHIAQELGLLPTTPNFQDMILKNLLVTNYDFEKANELNSKIDKFALKEPQFTDAEIKKFEDGIRKYGSELWPTYNEVKTQKFGMIVRFYYLWKKTKNGRLIWGNFADRKKFKASSSTKADEPKGKNPEADIANEHDDSSYDVEKTANKDICCKHCKTRESRQWFRSSGQQHPDDSKTTHYALCLRCARLWRRYAVIWEDPNEVYRKTSQKGGNGWKRKVEHELAIDADLILKARRESYSATPEVGVLKSKKNSVSSSVCATEPIADEVKPKKAKDEEEVKQKRTYTKHAKEEKQKPEEIELLVSSVLTDSNTGNNTTTNNNTSTTIPSNSNLQTAITERYYQITSPYYNTRPKFKDSTHLNKIHSKPSGSKNPVAAVPSSSVLNSEPCSVCFHTDKDDVLSCSNCKIVVHPSCYGIDFDKSLQREGVSLSSYNWNCDSCSNSLNPVISEDYNCVLCRDEHDDLKKGGRPHGALKRTSDGHWAHVLCALLVNDVKFHDINSLQPVLGTGRYNVIRNLGKDNGGDSESLLKCDECSKPWRYGDLSNHGDNSAARAWFKFLDSNDSKPDMKSIKIGNALGKIQPVVICNEHQDAENLHAFDVVGKRYKHSSSLPLLRIFLEDHKKSDKYGLSGVVLRFKELKDILDIVQKRQNNANGESDTIIRNGINELNKCTNCETADSIYWINDQCYKCFMDRKHNVITDDDNGSVFIEIGINSENEIDCSKYGFKHLDSKVARPAPESTDTYDFKECEDVTNSETFEKWANEFNPFRKPTPNSVSANGVSEPVSHSTENSEIKAPLDDAALTPLIIEAIKASSTSDAILNPQPIVKSEPASIFQPDQGSVQKQKISEEVKPLLVSPTLVETDADGDVTMHEEKKETEPQNKNKMSIGSILG